MENRRAILDKIKKCLAIASSSNEHEAAAGLRQARALMEKHGINQDALLAHEASERRTQSSAKNKPSRWEASMAQKISMVFGCIVLYGQGKPSKAGSWVFVGCGSAPEIAGYAFEVLLRQCKRARANHIKNHLFDCPRTSKTKRADMFCDGWVHTAIGKVSSLAESSQQAHAINAYVASHYQVGEVSGIRDRNHGKVISPHDVDDMLAGFHSGKNAELNRGVPGSEQSTLQIDRPR